MVHTLSDAELRCRLKETLAEERSSLCAFLRLLNEFERRKLQKDSAYSSLHAFCKHELGLPDAEAYKRIQTARAAAKYPVILELLESGLLYVSAIAVLAPHLTPENHVPMLENARGKSKRELEFYVASLSGSRPAQLDVVIPVPPLTEAVPLVVNSLSTSTDATGVACERIVDVQAPGARVAFTADAEMLADMEKLKILLSHKLPAQSGRQIAPMFKAALKALLKECDPEARPEPRRRAVKEGRRRIPKWVKRLVWKRDGAQCTFRGADEQRCPCKTWLEYDHKLPFALGGKSDDPDNIRLMCRAHNQRLAEDVFGEDGRDG